MTTNGVGEWRGTKKEAEDTENGKAREKTIVFQQNPLAKQ
jgi:hypothetical protein